MFIVPPLLIPGQSYGTTRNTFIPNPPNMDDPQKILDVFDQWSKQHRGLADAQAARAKYGFSDSNKDIIESQGTENFFGHNPLIAAAPPRPAPATITLSGSPGTTRNIMVPRQRSRNFPISITEQGINMPFRWEELKEIGSNTKTVGGIADRLDQFVDDFTRRAAQAYRNELAGGGPSYDLQWRNPLLYNTLESEWNRQRALAIAEGIQNAQKVAADLFLKMHGIPIDYLTSHSSFVNAATRQKELADRPLERLHELAKEEMRLQGDINRAKFNFSANSAAQQKMLLEQLIQEANSGSGLTAKEIADRLQLHKDLAALAGKDAVELVSMPNYGFLEQYMKQTGLPSRAGGFSPASGGPIQIAQPGQAQPGQALTREQLIKKISDELQQKNQKVDTRLVLSEMLGVPLDKLPATLAMPKDNQKKKELFNLDRFIKVLSDYDDLLSKDQYTNILTTIINSGVASKEDLINLLGRAYVSKARALGNMAPGNWEVKPDQGWFTHDWILSKGKNKIFLRTPEGTVPDIVLNKGGQLASAGLGALLMNKLVRGVQASAPGMLSNISKKMTATPVGSGLAKTAQYVPQGAGAFTGANIFSNYADRMLSKGTAEPGQSFLFGDVLSTKDRRMLEKQAKAINRLLNSIFID